MIQPVREQKPTEAVLMVRVDPTLKKQKIRSIERAHPFVLLTA
jgi:hypothetical protein